MLPLRTIRNSDKGGDLRETHENWDDPAVVIRKPERLRGGTRAGRPTGATREPGRVRTPPTGSRERDRTGGQVHIVDEIKLA